MTGTPMLARFILVFLLGSSWLVPHQAFGEDYKDIAFAGIQRLINSATSEVISEQALLENSSAPTSQLIIKRRGLQRQLETIRVAIAEAVGETAAIRRRRSRLLEEDIRVSQELEDVNAQILSAIPEFMSAVRQQPLTIAEVQTALTTREAVMVLAPTQNGTTIFTIAKQSSQWDRADMNAQRVNELVGNIRNSLSLSGETRGRIRVPSSQQEVLSNFDGESAHLLYAALIRDHVSALEGVDTLYFVRSGSLRGLPFSLLMTSEPVQISGFTEVSGGEFLIDDYAISEIPTIANLVAMRRPTQQTYTNGVRFVGVGAPDLTGQQRHSGSNRNATVRGVANADLLRTLPPLPGTLRELDMIVASLPAGSQRTVVTGDIATEKNLRGPLGPVIENSDLVLFATHGLLHDNAALNGISEPGLVVTPPDISEHAADDGFIAASEIAQMKLGADLVILSACNTIGGTSETRLDGIGALSQSFFSAGAGAVVASHWPVEDDATASLMAKLVQSLSNTEQGPKSLQAAILEARAEGLLEDPYQWGAFAYVGLSPQ